MGWSGRVLREEARRSVETLGELRMKSPRTIYTGELEEALKEGSEIFRLLEGRSEDFVSWYAVRRLYSGVHVELDLLSKMSAALRIRMMELNKLYVSGLDYFHRRLDKAIVRAYELVEA